MLSQPGATEFPADHHQLLKLVADGYIREGKRYMTVAIGCTGGKHRSVAIAEALAGLLTEDRQLSVRVLHRIWGANEYGGREQKRLGDQPGGQERSDSGIDRRAGAKRPGMSIETTGGISPRIVALGGGHGLYATLSAARRLTPHVTAVVTVADDGGSSGRLRSGDRHRPAG